MIRNQAIKLRRHYLLQSGERGGVDFFLGVDKRYQAVFLAVINGAKNFNFSSIKFRIWA